MPTCNVVKLRQEFEALRADKKPVEALWDEIETYIMPATGKATDQRAKLETDLEAWDLTAPLSCEHLASTLHGSVTSPAAKWLDFEWQDPELDRDQDALKYLEELGKVVWGALQSSDFNMEIASGYHEFAGIGNMCLSLEVADDTKWDGLDFTAIPCREAYPVADSRGGLRKFFRHLRWTAVQVLDRFGEEGTPKKIRELAALPQGAIDKLDVVFCIYRRDLVALDAEAPLVADKRPFGFVYFTLGKTEDEGEAGILGEEGGYYEMPVVLARWGRVPGSVWGFGRGNIALRQVKWLNGFKEASRAAGEKAVTPSTYGTELSTLSAIDHEPGGHTVVSNMDDLKVLESKSDFAVSAEVLRDERAEVRRCFHEDDLQLKESPAMTATEVQARRDLMDRVLGSPVGRLQTDALVPVVMITLGHLHRAGKLPEAPASVKAKKAEAKVKFRGPIARAQLMDEVVGIERSAAFAASLIKMGFEDAKYYFDCGQAFREHAKRVGSPAATIRSEADVKKAKEADAAMAARAQNAEVSKTEGEAMRAMAQARGMAPAGGGTGGLAIAPQPALAPSGGIVA